mmetsp:Transcript_104782/g.223953  ORF Transcript_104782/g.223953 Transcript_104782/m.223953 type:complete len:212 (-) Transcript_104782:55-690(-)
MKPIRPASLALPGTPAEDKDLPPVIFLENPDGSLALGLPPGAQLLPAPLSPRRGPACPDLARQVEDLECSFQRHERVFSGLLLTELVVEFAFSLALVSCAGHSVQEVSRLYKTLSLSTLRYIFWGLFACEISYYKVYYGLGFTALYKNRPRFYHWFTNVALAGILIQVLFAYMNKLNLLVFVLRLASYVYAKFMRFKLQRMALLPALVTEV